MGHDTATHSQHSGHEATLERVTSLSRGIRSARSRPCQESFTQESDAICGAAAWRVVAVARHPRKHAVVDLRERHTQRLGSIEQAAGSTRWSSPRAVPHPPYRHGQVVGVVGHPCEVHGANEPLSAIGRARIEHRAAAVAHARVARVQRGLVIAPVGHLEDEGGVA